MARADYAYTAEYEYVSPSMYAYARTQAETPPEERPYSRPDKEKAEPLKVNKENEHAERRYLSNHQAIRVIACMALIGLLLIGIVWTNARMSAINYSINQLKSRNATLENDIVLLTIEIESSNSIQTVEEYATENLGLRYPDTKQCIYIEDTENDGTSLAEMIKAKVYTKEKDE